MRFLAGPPVGVVAVGLSYSASTASDFRFFDCWEFMVRCPQDLTDCNRICPRGWLIRCVLAEDNEISSVEVCASHINSKQ